MPDIVIKQTLNDSAFRNRLDENGQHMRRWATNAQKEFERVRAAAAESAEWNSHKMTWSSPDSKSPEFAWAAAMAEAGRTGRPQRYQQAYNRPELDVPDSGNAMTGFSNGLKTVASEIPGVGRLLSFLGSGAGIATAGFTAGAAAAIGFAQSVAEAAAESRNLVLESQKLDIGIAAFETLSELADDSGTTIQAVGGTIEKMSKNLGEAVQEPAGNASKTIQSLGLSVQSLVGMAPERAFEVLGTAIGQVENKFERARMEVAAFGKSGQELDLLLRNMAKGGLKDASDTAVSAFDRAALAQFGEKLDWLGDKWNQFWTSVKANAARAMLNPEDMARVQEKLSEKTGTSPADSRSQQIQAAAKEIEKLQASLMTDRDKFISTYKPSSEMLSKWDELTAKMKSVKGAGKDASDAIGEITENIRKMNYEMAGVTINKPLEDFDKNRKYKDGDIDRLQKEIERQRGALYYTESDPTLDKDRNYPTPEGNRRLKSSQRVTEGFKQEIAELERQKKEAETERSQRAQLEKLPEREKATRTLWQQQQDGDAAVKSWKDRLRVATTDADDIAASLIAGSREFNGNIEEAEKFIQKVKSSEATKKLSEDAKKFEESMRAEFSARKDETSREAQLRSIAEKGLDKGKAAELAKLIAELDAKDAVNKRSNENRLAPNLGLGSREAYDTLARAQSNTPDPSVRIAQEQNRRLLTISSWLEKIYKKAGAVAPAP